MSHRAFVDDLSPGSVRIEDAEAHHLLHVLRVRTGETIELFDGRGLLAEGRITEVSRRHLDAEILYRRHVPASALLPLTVAAAPPKGDRLKWMVEKLTELGVARLILLHSERTVVTPGETRLDKLRSMVIGACKQSGRPRLLQLEGLTTPAELLQSHAGQSPAVPMYLAHPDHRPAARWPGDVRGSSQQSAAEGALLLIGPEGGFTAEEVDTFTARGARTIAWPETILRIETAAVTFAALLLHTHGLRSETSSAGPS